MAQEVRIGLARLGMKSLDELVGRADLLRQKSDLQLGKTTHLDMSFLTTYAGHEPGDSSHRRSAEVRFCDGICRFKLHHYALPNSHMMQFERFPCC